MRAEQKKVIFHTACTVGGSLFMNGTLQLAVYPMLNRQMGPESMGSLLYVMGLAAIVCPSVGQALNTSRLVVRRDAPVSNGDYVLLVLFFSGAGAILSALLAFHQGAVEGGAGLLFPLPLLILTAFRYYGDVEYRLSLQYQRYFIYYAILSLGYLLGFGLYRQTGSWPWIFLIGEGLALLYLALTGSVFKEPFKKSPAFQTAFTRGSLLVVSYLITNLTLNVDRLALKSLGGNLAVTQYYVVSLIGKTLVLLVAPVNTILISYLSRRKEALSKREFSLFAGAGLLASFVFFLGTQIVTPVFVQLLYPDLSEGVRGLISVVNLSQILGLTSAYLFMVVLTFTAEKWQLVLQAAHLCLTVLLVIACTPRGGIQGFSRAVLIANAARVLAVLVLGFIGSSKKKAAEKPDFV